MKGKHRIVVSTKRQKYEFELRRNLTILRGDSATGKTTLIEMIQDHENDPLGSPVELISDKKCYVLEGALWKEQLAGITDSIVFIDEGNTFVKAEEFAGVIQNTDNYYVMRLMESRKNIVLYLPESFEWLILSAGVLKNAAMEKILKNPSEYVESRNYFSWERFFTALLIEETKGTYLAYFKRNLNPVYLNESIKTAILSQMKKIKIDRKK
jgi:hypothetical protein